jgi:DnaJ-class molecular chaperone
MDHTRRAVTVFTPTPDADDPLACIVGPEHHLSPITTVLQSSAVGSAPAQATHRRTDPVEALRHSLLERCPKCAGVGTMACGACQRQARISHTCAQCRGQGSVACLRCFGRGHVMKRDRTR